MRIGSLLLLAAFPAAFAYAADTVVSLEPIGGPGGSQYLSRCSQGEALGGLELHVGDDVDAIRAICIEVDSGERRPERSTYGGSGGDRRELLCPDDNPVMTGVVVDFEGDATTVVNGIQLKCGQASTAQDQEVSGQSFLGPAASLSSDGRLGGRETQRCPAGLVALGIHGRSGAWVDAFGLICDLPPNAVSLDPIPSWNQWFRITDGGGLKSPVTALTPRAGHVDLFVTGNDGFVYSTYHEAAVGWQKWFRLGDLQVPSRSPITAVATRPGHIDLFVVGKDGGVYSTFHEADGGWRPWFRIGYVGVAAGSNVAALQPRDGHMDLFVVGSDSKIYSTYHEAEGGWRNWFPIHEMRSPVGSEITALLSRPGHIDLFVSGTEGGVYSTYHEAAGGWRPWFRLGNIEMQPGSPVTAVSTIKDEQIDLFAVGTDGAVYSTFHQATGDWKEWFIVIGRRAVLPATRLAALATRPGHLDLFGVDKNGVVFSTYFEGNRWHAWFRIHGMASTPGAAVTALATRPGHVDLFVSGIDSGVYSNWHE